MSLPQYNKPVQGYMKVRVKERVVAEGLGLSESSEELGLLG